MKTVFKVGDKVFHICYGWGTIQKIQDTMIDVGFNGQKVYTFTDNSLLSFTEYTLQGFTQKKPIELPEVGEYCLVRDADSEEWKAAIFKGYDSTHKYPFITKRGFAFKQLKRIKILD